jgi:hypothetical protein
MTQDDSRAFRPHLSGRDLNVAQERLVAAIVRCPGLVPTVRASPLHSSRIQTREPLLFASVGGKIESQYPRVIGGPFQHLGVPQRAACIVVSGAPMLFHAEARELVILGMAFVVLCAIDQMNDVVDLAIGGSAEQLSAGKERPEALIWRCYVVLPSGGARNRRWQRCSAQSRHRRGRGASTGDAVDLVFDTDLLFRHRTLGRKAHAGSGSAGSGVVGVKRAAKSLTYRLNIVTSAIYGEGLRTCFWRRECPLSALKYKDFIQSIGITNKLQVWYVDSSCCPLTV